MRMASFFMSSLSRARVDERDHLDRLRVMADHALHESGVRLGVRELRLHRALGRRDLTALLTRRSRLNDLWPRTHLRAATRSGQQHETDCAQSVIHGVKYL